jgi:lipopolysaccharide transport system permease protein
MLADIARNAGLILGMTKREVVGRYKGSLMGVAWSFLNPLFMLAIYTFFFSAIFKARWETGSESKVDFAIILFVGLIVHGIFAECITRAPMLIVGNVNYVKKVVFPLEILPVVALCSALFHGMVSMLVLQAAIVATGSPLHLAALLAPLLILPTALAALGSAWLLASLGVFLRDIGQLATIMATTLLFLSPVFYPISAMPERYRLIMTLNPLTVAIEQMRGAIVWGRLPDWGDYALQLGLAFFVAWLGYWWFQRTRKGFADVL